MEGLSADGQYAKAIDAWREHLRRRPDDPSAANIHVDIANTYYSLRKALEALEEYEQATQINPDQSTR